jgi:hypothetical protein
MIKTPLTPLELEGLLQHNLLTDRPSQLSDAFRLGMAFALSQPKSKIINVHYNSHQGSFTENDDTIHWPVVND